MTTKSMPLLRVLALCTLGVGLPLISHALTVINPPAGSTATQSGTDYATQVVGDAWDMNNAQDIDTDESTNLAAETFSGGVYSAAASTCSSLTANLYPLFMGYGVQTVAIARGPRFPIDTSKYRYFTMKIKASSTQQDRMVFLQTGDSYTNGTFGSTLFKSLAANQWTIQAWDMYTDTFGSPNMPWQGFPTIQGIRLDPCTSGSTNIQIDWIRLTAAPTAGQFYSVTWSDTVSTTYTITAIDADGARFPFNASGVSGTSYAADVSRLAPGDYHIEVKRADNSATALSTGVLHLNIPPQLQILAPTQRGEQSQSYAILQQGGQWGPMSAADFTPSPPPNFINVSYTNPVGSFNGRPINSDPQFIMKTTGHPIVASFYRSACFTLDVFGPRSIGSGSVARLFWGVNSSGVSTTTDIVLGNGLVEYCMPDLADTAAVPLVTGSPQPWSGSLGYFRMDPDEFTPPGGCSTPQTCHDVRLDSLILAPFATANPVYIVNWTVTDPDYGSGGSIQIFLDPDSNFGNGNEIGIATVPYTIGSYKLVADQTISNSTYRLVLLADDGKNAVAQYAGGKIVTNNADVIFRNDFE